MSISGLISFLSSKECIFYGATIAIIYYLMVSTFSSADLSVLCRELWTSISTTHSTKLCIITLIFCLFLAVIIYMIYKCWNSVEKRVEQRVTQREMDIDFDPSSFEGNKAVNYMQKSSVERYEEETKEYTRREVRALTNSEGYMEMQRRKGVDKRQWNWQTMERRMREEEAIRKGGEGRGSVFSGTGVITRSMFAASADRGITPATNLSEHGGKSV